jgi:phenylpropionate dioxygenase-like ring-hydroxylating dioxygenase large terminal subunit
MTEDHPAPVPPGGRVPASRYRSRAFWELEWDRLWTRVWLLAGHVGRLAAPGDYFTLEVGPESLLVARGEDGRVRAFYNVCQHRGNVLCPAESGRVAAFECSYHRWCYRLDGALARAPARDHLAGEIRLAEIPCAVRLGFVWISMSAEPEPIDAFLAPVAPAIAAYRPERFTARDETTVAVACNWKTSVDVNNESYHLRSLHPELLEWIDDAQVREELLGRHSSIHVPLRGALAARARVEAEAEGIDLSALPDEALVEKRQFHVFPNVQLNFTARSLEVYRHRPSGSDPLATLFDEQSYELLPPGVAARPRRARRIEHSEASLGPVMDADVDLLPLLTRGMASRGFPGLSLGAREGCIANMHRAIDGYLFPVESTMGLRPAETGSAPNLESPDAQR